MHGMGSRQPQGAGSSTHRSPTEAGPVPLWVPRAWGATDHVPGWSLLRETSPEQRVRVPLPLPKGLKRPSTAGLSTLPWLEESLSRRLQVPLSELPTPHPGSSPSPGAPCRLCCLLSPPSSVRFPSAACC